jgi:hypothetical protein
MAKSKRMEWVVHVACMREIINLNNTLIMNLKERYHLGDQGVDGRIIF